LATKWICSAAKKELPGAQFKIAELYNRFNFSLPGYAKSIKKLPSNDQIALAWFIVAEKNGHPEAKEGREIFRKMAFEDVVAAIDLAKKYPEIPCETE
jgi:TPR repeat protein